MKKLLALFLLLFLIGVLTSCNSNFVNEEEAHVHSYAPFIVTQTATCESDGIQRSYCACGDYLEVPVPAADHNYVENICTKCGIDYYDTDFYRYNQLKPYGEKLAIYNAKKQVKEIYGYKGEIISLEAKIVESDMYFHYVVDVGFKVNAADDTTNTYNKTFVVAINPNLNGNGSYLEAYDQKSLLRAKSTFNWGEKATDFSYDFYDNLQSPLKVTVRQLLDNPEKYIDKYVEIVDRLYIRKMDTTRQSYFLSESSNGQADSCIEAFYDRELVDISILTSIGSRVSCVTGYVYKYSDGDKAYIVLYEINFE